MLGGYEWIIVLVAIGLLLFGSKKIPEFVRSMGMAVSEFKRGKMMVEREIQAEFDMSSTKPVKRAKEDKKQKKKRTLKKRVVEKDPIDERIRIVKRARDLGIETKGKDNALLEKEIEASIL